MPADLSGTITLGTPFTASITTPGQKGEYTVSGASGQWLSLNLSSVTTTGCTVTIKKPDTTTLSQVTFGTGGVFVEPFSLPTTGTYTLVVDPGAHYTGNVTVGLYDVVTVTGSLMINDPATSISIPTPGQTARYTFSGTASQQVTVRLTGNTMSTVNVQLLKPDGSVLVQSTSSSGSFNLSAAVLPTTGTYTVVINPSGTNTGSVNLQVTSP